MDWKQHVFAKTVRTGAKLLIPMMSFHHYQRAFCHITVYLSLFISFFIKLNKKTVLFNWK